MALYEPYLYDPIATVKVGARYKVRTRCEAPAYGRVRQSPLAVRGQFAGHPVPQKRAVVSFAGISGACFYAPSTLGYWKTIPDAGLNGMYVLPRYPLQVDYLHPASCWIRMWGPWQESGGHPVRSGVTYLTIYDYGAYSQNCAGSYTTALVPMTPAVDLVLCNDAPKIAVYWLPTGDYNFNYGYLPFFGFGTPNQLANGRWVAALANWDVPGMYYPGLCANYGAYDAFGISGLGGTVTVSFLCDDEEPPVGSILLPGGEAH